MPVQRFRKKPVVIEALRYTGENWSEAGEFMGCKELSSIKGVENGYNVLTISTLEGEMVANPGDYIIKGINGEFYPCKPDIFDKTYDLVEEKP